VLLVRFHLGHGFGGVGGLVDLGLCRWHFGRSRVCGSDCGCGCGWGSGG
jgi:hypothetical protein